MAVDSAAEDAVADADSVAVGAAAEDAVAADAEAVAADAVAEDAAAADTVVKSYNSRDSKFISKQNLSSSLKISKFNIHLKKN